jgi:hypothetical protein
MMAMRSARVIALDLVMGDIDHRIAQLLVQAFQFHTQVGAQLGVQVRQRLVEQEHIHIAHQRAPDRHALALAARQGARLALQQRFDLQDPGGAGHAFCDLVAGQAGILQPEGQVPLDRHLGVERVGLEHHADAAL